MRVLTISGPLPVVGRPGSLAPVARQIDSIRQLGVDITSIEIRGIGKLKYVQTLPKVLAKAADVDLIHAHFGYSGWLALCQRRRPVVISFMGSDLLGRTRANGEISLGSKLVVRLNRFAARRADAVIVKSVEMAAVLGDVPAHVVPNGVDLDAFKVIDRVTARRRLGWKEEGLTVLFLGNPEFPNKGYAIVRAAVDLAARKLSRPVDLQILWGVAPDSVATWMSAADAMVLASQTEGSPNVVKEALACELPIVATRVGDVPDLLASVAGCFLTDRAPEPIGVALAAALAHGRLDCGRKLLAERGLDQPTVARKLLSIYDGVLETTRGHT